MNLQFEATQGSAVDRVNGLEIFRPRMLPLEAHDAVEFQFAIYQGDKRHGFGCNGTFHVVQKNEGCAVRVFTLDLGEDLTVEWAAELKVWLNLPGDSFGFLVGLADGLAKSFQGRTDNYDEELRYEVVSNVASLIKRGFAAPDDVTRGSDGEIVLATVRVPLHPMTDVVP